MIQGYNKNKRRAEKIKHTIILSRLLPRREVPHIRWFADGKKLSTELVMKLLRDAGHEITSKEEPSMRLSNMYKGIKLTSHNGGLMVCPKKTEDLPELTELLIKDGFFFHACYLPGKRKETTLAQQ